uniref:Uncharacterized protein n=1 Tax=Siphoviridae sp. ctxMM9 TaxID=2827973 RepID=A0A8S5T617_9CAUD|nr:MAG TPA: hypothetical protein [Siphoviridae sp. ctxMM9]
MELLILLQLGQEQMQVVKLALKLAVAALQSARIRIILTLLLSLVQLKITQWH